MRRLYVISDNTLGIIISPRVATISNNIAGNIQTPPRRPNLYLVLTVHLKHEEHVTQLGNNAFLAVWSQTKLWLMSQEETRNSSCKSWMSDLTSALNLGRITHGLKGEFSLCDKTWLAVWSPVKVDLYLYNLYALSHFTPRVSYR